jgi:hypothetical protein
MQERYYNDKDESDCDFNDGRRSQLDVVLADVKHRLRTTIEKKKALIIRLGEEFEKALFNP